MKGGFAWAECACHQLAPLVDFRESSHTRGLENGTPVATLTGTWLYRVQAGTGWSGISIMRLGVIETLICNFYLSVSARTIVRAGASLGTASLA